MILPTARPEHASAEINALEQQWWNENADLVREVWELDELVSRAIRRGYLSRAKDFLAAGPRRPTRVLELGCGSGWVGQSIAGPDLDIVGTDFSRSQIDLAGARARRFGVERYCRYHVSDALMPPASIGPIDAALIHAFLHHLDQSEINEVLDAVAARLPQGGRIWIYEPGFFATSVPPDPGRRVLLAARLRAIRAAFSVFRRLANAFNLNNQPVLDRLSSLQRRAADNGWYLTPKEIPMDVATFSAQLSSRFGVVGSYWATLYAVGWAAEVSVLTSSVLRSFARGSLLAAAARVDGRICEDEDYANASLVAPMHGFRVWECVVRARQDLMPGFL